jgi:two-component system CheB/CheR fusion protein
MARTGEEAMTARFSIVGIGASAGGVEALESFFGAMPAQNGMAFVVVTHLDPKHESWLADIIGRRTTMQVAAARDGDEVEPERVYVLPPAAIMTIEQGRLHLQERDAGSRGRAPIDIFFNSLAEDQGEDAVGIVLSGGGSDGTLGITAIKEHGGLTLAQASKDTEPRFKDMPESATATGLVDLVVPVEQMPERLLSYVRSAGEVESDRVAAATTAIYALLRTRAGHDFSQYKQKTFGRRVQRRMQVLQLTNIDAYVERLQKDPDEITLLFRDLLIGVTSFFRDPDAFRALETLVISKILDGKGADQEVRVWVPGCSTGEEVYSIAILLREHMDKLPSAPKVQIFGSDIDEGALTVARNGRYPESLLKNISRERLERYFVLERDGYRVVKEMRDMCIFSPHSVLRDPPFSRIDLISCRNLLIYLQAELQARIMPIFHYALRADGFLFLGLSETIARHGDLFSPIDKDCRIFQRRDLVTPLSPSVLQFMPQGRGAPAAWRSPREPRALSQDILRSAAEAVLERFAPAHVVVNAQGEILHYSIRTGKYLEPAAGAPSRDLFAMARKELRPDLRAALRTAVETHRSVTRDHIVVATNGGGAQTIILTVQPITAGGDTAFLIVFTDVGPIRPQEEVAGDGPLPSTEDAAVQQLERELQETKQNLQATIEELETSNEELKSSNEEMLSVNEELQSSNEELEASKEETQSINEELQTVNSELHRKVAELDHSSSDLRNVFESTQVGTIFLDRRLVIRSFTAAISDIYNLVPGDRGRSLTDLASRLDGQTLESDVREVFERQRPIERRVSADKGAAHYLMRVLPYRATDGEIDGVLVTFTAITTVVASEQHQKALTAELSRRVKNTLAVVASIARRTGAHARTVDAFLDTFLGRLRGLSFTHDLLSQGEWADAPLRDLIRLELAPCAAIDGIRLEVEGPPIALKPRAALAFGMVIHELATNSVKFGALSVPEGRLKVTWTLMHQSPATEVQLCWLESGGPPPASVKRGFGTEFIERAMRFELDGEAKIAFEQNGLRCIMTAPVGADIVTSFAEAAMPGADDGKA